MATDANELGFELLPADDEAWTAEDDLAAATSSALTDDPEAIAPEAEEPPVPLGYSWAFDFEAGRFLRHGQAPARVTGLDVLKQRCLMALHSARYAHVIFSDEFGIEKPLHGIGTAGVEAHEAADDWREMIRDALLVLEDVADVQMEEVSYDPVAGVIFARDLVVTTNEDVELPFGDIRLQPERELI